MIAMSSDIGTPWRTCLCIGMLLMTASIYGQQAPSTEHAHGTMSIVVDGRKTPNLVPDDLAYKHWLNTIAEHANCTADETRRQSMRLNRIGLSSEDLSAVKSALAGLREDLDQIENARATTGDSQELRTRFGLIMNAARARLLSSLSPAGVTTLDTYIRDRVKPSIVIFGSN
jgi:hypothetical protein